MKPGLKAVLREDPDIILIGEMRSLDAIETALIGRGNGAFGFYPRFTPTARRTLSTVSSVFFRGKDNSKSGFNSAER